MLHVINAFLFWVTFYPIAAFTLWLAEGCTGLPPESESDLDLIRTFVVEARLFGVEAALPAWEKGVEQRRQRRSKP